MTISNEYLGKLTITFLICPEHRLSVEFWTFLSSLVCSYIILLLCQQNILKKRKKNWHIWKLSRGRLDLSPVLLTSQLQSYVWNPLCIGSTPVIWHLQQGLAHQPILLHCYTSILFTSPDWAEAGAVVHKSSFPSSGCVSNKRGYECAEHNVLFCCSSPVPRLWDQCCFHPGAALGTSGVLRDNEKAILPCLQ